MPKNTKKYTINGNSVIPDAVTDTHIIEIKDTKVVNQTKQIKTEMAVAEEEGKIIKLITGEKTHVSKKISKYYPVKIERRPDLGPQ